MKDPCLAITTSLTPTYQEDTQILQVPTALLRTINTVPRKSVRQKLPMDMSVHGLLAVDLALDKSDMYAEWNAVCPSKSDIESSVPLAWSTDLQSHLPSPAAELLRKQQAKFTRDWNIVRAAFPDITEEDYRYAWLLVNTRTFYHSTPKTEKMHRDDRMALQPVADLFNHADEGCDVHFNPECFTIRTNRAYEEGEEVYICYGRHGNDFLLAEYGFILHVNQWDEVGLDDIILPELSKKQTQELEDAGFLGNYRLDASQVCYRTQTALRILALDLGTWRRVVDGLDDEDDSKEMADELLLRLLKRYDQDVVKIIEDVEGLPDHGDHSQGQKRMLVRRWTQIRTLIGRTMESLESEC